MVKPAPAPTSPMSPMPAPLRPSPFRLTRWFAALSAVVIGLLALANAGVIANFLTDQLIQREASLTRDFVQNVMVSDGSMDVLRHTDDPELRQRFEGSVLHLTNMRDVLRINVYTADRRVLWSSDRQLIGQRFDANDELDEAMRGDLVVHAGRIGPDERAKPEYVGLAPGASFFVETYVPIVAPGGSTIGVVELYKVPRALAEAIHDGQRRVALVALVGALVLFVSLWWLVARAERTLHAQRAQLIEAETLAAMGELATSVAHNIRNPLASIRSSAELAMESPAEHAEDSARDILREVDRLSARITELLRVANQGAAEVQRVPLGPLLQGCVADHAPAFERRGQQLELDDGAGGATVLADANLLRQVVQSLLSNASEAMAAGGRCQVRLSGAGKGHVAVEVADTGAGIPPELLAQVFRPFFTTKPQGLGLGLPFARRFVERLGGRLELSSTPGQGTTVRIELPRA